MRVPINLASQPFSRNRSTLVISSIIGLALLALAGLLTFLILAERSRAEENRTRVADLNTQLDSIRREQSKIDRTMQEPANAAVLQRSVLLNTLIERKSVSWTKLLSDIESVEPSNVRVVQIRLPQLNSRNQITLDMEVGAKQPADAIEFFDNLAKSKLFGPAALLRSDPPTDADPLYRYRLTVNYGQN